jgi:hypothetical protein
MKDVALVLKVFKVALKDDRQRGATPSGTPRSSCSAYLHSDRAWREWRRVLLGNVWACATVSLAAYSLNAVDLPKAMLSRSIRQQAL